ncbi:type 4a pilus biogenesis protein PilO [Clostridium sp. D53t1_180928_C8]|uniref:type 4a pilus biogenesis protein PilO n=1 Tax=Clostridium sp. D53t1_180928_C8 TaxID=2787101 RepID=UPI0018AA533C|nr:type 4a pilus biogenesis protein PilO [Clostridium sp. D53t1_180928_C8]
MEVKQSKQNSIIVYLKNLSKKDKVILSSTIIALSLTFGLKFLIVPQLEQYTNNLMILDMKKSEQARVKIIPSQNKILEEKQEELKFQYDSALEELSKTPAVAQVIYDLEQLIRKNNIELKSLSFSNSDVFEEEINSDEDVKTDENGVVTEVDRGLEIGNSEGEVYEVGDEQAVKKQIVNISLTGEYENIINFIKSIEQYSRISDVSNISLSSGEGNLLNVSLTANFYNLNYKESEYYDFNNKNYGKENSFN